MEYAWRLLFFSRCSSSVKIAIMNNITLVDWGDAERLYFFDSGANICPSSKHPAEGATITPQGFYSEEILGIFHRSKVAIAVFSDGHALRMSLNGKLYNLTNPEVACKLKRLCFFATKFSLIDQHGSDVTFHYWAANTDSGGIGGDIFEYAERITENSAKKAEFLELWNSVKAGQKPYK